MIRYFGGLLFCVQSLWWRLWCASAQLIVFVERWLVRGGAELSEAASVGERTAACEASLV